MQPKEIKMCRKWGEIHLQSYKNSKRITRNTPRTVYTKVP